MRSEALSRLSRMSESEETEVLPTLYGEVEIAPSEKPVEILAIERRPPVGVIPAAAAAGGVVAGAAVLGLVQRRHRRALVLAKGRRPRALGRRARASRRSSAPAELLQIVSSRSVLLDIHLLGGSGSDS